MQGQGQAGHSSGSSGLGRKDACSSDPGDPYISRTTVDKLLSRSGFIGCPSCTWCLGTSVHTGHSANFLLRGCMAAGVTGDHAPQHRTFLKPHLGQMLPPPSHGCCRPRKPAVGKRAAGRASVPRIASTFRGGTAGTLRGSSVRCLASSGGPTLRHTCDK